MSAALLHLNMAQGNSIQQLHRMDDSPEKGKGNPLNRRKSGISADSNEFISSNRSKGAMTRASTFTQAMALHQNVQNIQLTSVQQQPFTQVQVGKTLKRKLIKFTKSKQ